MRQIVAVAVALLIVCGLPLGGFLSVSSSDMIADIIGQVQEDQLREHICQFQSREGGSTATSRARGGRVMPRLLITL